MLLWDLRGHVWNLIAEMPVMWLDQSDLFVVFAQPHSRTFAAAQRGDLMSPWNNKLGNMNWQESQTQSIAWQTRAQMKKLQLHYQSQTSSFCIKRKGLLDRRRQNPELKPVFIGYTWITSTTKGQSTTDLIEQITGILFAFSVVEVWQKNTTIHVNLTQKIDQVWISIYTSMPDRK